MKINKIQQPAMRATLVLAAVLLAPAASAQGDFVKGLMNGLNGLKSKVTPAVTELVPGNTPAAAPMQADPSQVSSSVAALFAKQTVNGQDLIGTLSAIRLEMRQRKSQRATQVLLGTVDSAVNRLSNGSFDMSGMAQQAAVEAALMLVKQTVAGAATQALDDHLKSMVDDPRALADETITLPSPAGMSAAQMNRVATMAALVVGARVTAKVLKRAQAEMEALKTDYSGLIERREQAAKLLFSAIAERNKLLADSLTTDDLAFVDSDLGKLSVAAFSKDMAAQNLALGYLQKANPEAFSAYRVKADDVVSRTKTYVRTMTGVAAFGAMSANFAQTTAQLVREKQLGSMAQALPLVIDFLKEAAPLSQVAVETSLKGVELGVTDPKDGSGLGAFFRRKRSFVFTDGDGKPQDMGSAKDVFTALRKNESAALFVGALFRSDGPGLLQRIGECDRAEAGRMLDTAVPKAQRDEFASSYFPEADRASVFSFVEALESPGSSEREQLLPAELLASDYRERANAESTPLSKVQLRVSDSYSDWGDGHLMRLIFANKEGQARHATLYIGPLKIRPVASPESLFAYETIADSCKKLITQASLPRAVAPAPAAAAEPPKKASPKTAPKGKPPVKKDAK